MKSTGIKQFFLIWVFFCSSFFSGLRAQVSDYPYEQDFESDFTTGTAVEFLPWWWGNDVRTGTSRVYKAGAAYAHSGNAALGFVPTGTFTGEVRLAFDATQLEEAEISFWLRSGRNGSGTRPALVSVGFSADGGQTFIAGQFAGEPFPNADGAYEQYQFFLPDEIAGQAGAVLRIQVTRGEGGQGSAARVFLDDLRISSSSSGLRLLSASAVNKNEMLLRFNKAVDKASAEDVNNYRINKGISVQSASVAENSERIVRLNTSDLDAGERYTLALGNIFDREGNSAAGQVADVIFEDNYELQTYDLLISEIHAAPDDKTLLPNVEWVEIYNASGRTLPLEGVLFADESRSTSLPAYSLRAGEYLVLVSAAGVPLLREYGNVTGLNPWPNLNNTGDELSLYSPSGRLLDRVKYDQGWYNSSLKSQGGWSLERIDLSRPCLGAANWSAATGHSGGTPGQANSIATAKPDLTGPRLLQAYSTGPFTVQLVIDEAVDTTRLQPANFNLQPSVPIEKVQPDPLNPERLLLTFIEPLDSNGDYSLRLRNITDCSGNLMQESFSEAGIIFPVAAGPGEVRINEVMYNPLVSSEEWVEIVNITDKHINLRNWQLATWDSGIKSVAVLSRDFMILPAGGFLVFSRRPAGVQAAFPAVAMEKVIQVNGLPQLPNAGDSIALLEENGKVQDLFGYHDRLHSSFLKDTKGVSLERISPGAAINSAANWISASASSGHGTPGAPNSQQFTGGTAQEEGLFVEPGIIFPVGFGQPNLATIYFKSKRTGLQARLRIFDTMGREVRSLATHQLLGADTIFTWDGTNNSQNIVKTGYYIILIQVYDGTGYSKEFTKVLVVGN